MEKQEAVGDSQAPRGGGAWWAFMGTALAGVALSVYLSWVHVVVTYSGEAVEGLCNLSTKINCNVAAGSSYSSVMGVPIAVLGLGFYLGVAVMLLFHRRDGERHVPHMLMALFAAACLYSVFLAGISAFVLAAFCWACSSLYVVNVVGLVLARVLAGEAYLKTLRELVGDVSAIAPSRAAFATLVTILVSTGLGAWGSHALGAKMENSGDNPIKGQAWVQEEFSKISPLTGEKLTALQDGEAALGPAEAAVTVVEFSDFQCPFCSRVAPILKKLRVDFPDEVRIIFRQNPLGRACNPRLQELYASEPGKDFHPQACGAAKASVCAMEQGRFWEMHDQLFANQRALKAAQLPEHAQHIGLNVKEFHDCLASERPDATIQKDLKTVSLLGVKGTPTLFVNGRRLKGAVPYWKLKAAVAHELGQSGAP